MEATRDLEEASAFSHLPDQISIYSCSWGPPDDGTHLEAPRKYASQALASGTSMGRHGKGSVYVFASGNGTPLDGCNFDGYANSPHTITIGAVNVRWGWPDYAEICAATTVVAFSSLSSGSTAFTMVSQIKEALQDILFDNIRREKN